LGTICLKCGAKEVNDISVGKKCGWCDGMMVFGETKTEKTPNGEVIKQDTLNYDDLTEEQKTKLKEIALSVGYKIEGTTDDEVKEFYRFMLKRAGKKD